MDIREIYGHPGAEFSLWEGKRERERSGEEAKGVRDEAKDEQAMINDIDKTRLAGGPRCG